MLIACLLATTNLRVISCEVSKRLIAGMLMDSTCVGEVVGLLPETLAGISEPTVGVLPTPMQTCPRCVLILMSLVVPSLTLWLANTSRLLRLLHELKALSILHGRLVFD